MENYCLPQPERTLFHKSQGVEWWDAERIYRDTDVQIAEGKKKKRRKKGQQTLLLTEKEHSLEKFAIEKIQIMTKIFGLKKEKQNNTPQFRK